MDGLPAAIMDENGGWSTAFWYPHAPPTRKNGVDVPGSREGIICYEFFLFFMQDE